MGFRQSFAALQTLLTCVASELSHVPESLAYASFLGDRLLDSFTRRCSLLD